MKTALEEILVLAKQNLVTHRHLTPMAFVFKAGRMLAVAPMTMKVEKGEDQNGMNAFAAGALAARQGGDYLALLWDAAMKTYPDQKVPEQYDMPLTFPKTMRTECIMLIGVPLPVGDNDFLVAPYKGGEGEPVEFLKEDAVMDEGSCVKSRFARIARDGYKFFQEKAEAC